MSEEVHYELRDLAAQLQGLGLALEAVEPDQIDGSSEALWSGLGLIVGGLGKRCLDLARSLDAASVNESKE